MPLLFEPAAAGLNGQIPAVLQLDVTLLQGDPDRLRLILPDGRAFTATRSYWTWKSADHYSWFGAIEPAAGSGIGRPGLVSLYYRGGRLLGELRLPDGSTYDLVPDGDLHRLEAVSGSAAVSCDVGHREAELATATGLRPGLPPAGEQSDTACDEVPPGTVTVDLMVLYPLSLMSSAQAVSDYASMRTAKANMIFSDSGVNVQYNLVHVGMISGEQPPPAPTLEPGQDPESVEAPTKLVLDWLNLQFDDSDGVDTEVELLREAYAADMIAVVIPTFPNRNCGRANLPELVAGTEVMYRSQVPFLDKAFSTMELNCGNHEFTFTHELGHSWGMYHADNRRTRNIYPWAYGYLFSFGKGTLSTVMGCANPGANCNRIERFSNPDRAYPSPGGTPTGLHSSQSNNPAHNACVANLRAEQYRDFFAPPPSSPPSLAITSPAEGATVSSGALFTLAASATDPEDGDLCGSVSWRSDREGFLGTGSPRSQALTILGPHLITASVTDSSGTRLIKGIRLNVLDQDPPRRYLDRPLPNQLVSGNVQIYGWATDASGVVEVRYELDGAPAPELFAGFNYGGPRADVCQVHADLNDPNCPNVGFGGFLDTSLLTNGSHTVRVTLVDFYGNESRASRTFRTETSLPLTVPRSPTPGSVRMSRRPISVQLRPSNCGRPDRRATLGTPT